MADNLKKTSLEASKEVSLIKEERSTELIIEQRQNMVKTTLKKLEKPLDQNQSSPRN